MRGREEPHDRIETTPKKYRDDKHVVKSGMSMPEFRGADSLDRTEKGRAAKKSGPLRTHSADDEGSNSHLGMGAIGLEAVELPAGRRCRSRSRHGRRVVVG